MEQAQKAAKQSKPVSKVKIVILLLFAFFTVIGFIGLAWCWNTYQAMYRDIDITVLSKEPPKSAVFYDRNGGVITELTNARMEYMPLSKFPKTMIDALIAVEDERFYEHKGVDLYAIARAFYRNLQSGETVQGGSTITQQLAKTMLFSAEQSYSRKISEAVASIKIENTYTKDQILELYLNHVYFGEGAWGLERAAQVYFGKKASELTLAECALMAGIPKSPTNYSPVKQPEQSRDRRNLVLNLMAEQGKITAEARDAAKNEPINLTDKTALKQTASYPSSYVDHVINEAISKFGLSEQQILSAGLQFYTNLDPKVQAAADEVYRDPSFFPKDAGGLQSAIVLIEPKTGALLGMVGSRNPNKDYRGFNFATQLERQPGSTIKPILVYAPALSAGFGPKDQIDDVETDFGGGYKPSNYMKELHGWVTLEEALIQSYNIPAVALLKEIGIDKGMSFAKKAGLPLQDADRTYGIALGGMQKGTSPLTMAQAYTMFANNGTMTEAYAITKIVDRHGKVVKEGQSKPVQMLDPNIAYTMTTMLQKVVNQGTGQNAKMDRPVAGKTGTTQLPDIPEFKDKYGNQIDGSKDAWFVGYTPEIVGAVWLGYEKTNRDHYLNTTGGKYPAALFKEVVSRALADAPVTAFAKPDAYVAYAGGSKAINGDKESMLAKLYKSRPKKQETEKDTAPADETKSNPAAGADQTDLAKSGDPNQPAVPKNGAGPQPLQTAGAPAPSDKAGSAPGKEGTGAENKTPETGKTDLANKTTGDVADKKVGATSTSSPAAKVDARKDSGTESKTANVADGAPAKQGSATDVGAKGSTADAPPAAGKSAGSTPPKDGSSSKPGAAVSTASSPSSAPSESNAGKTEGGAAGAGQVKTP